jgi:hypothetical protein
MGARLDAQVEIGLQFERVESGDDKVKVEALGIICMFLGQGLDKSQYPVHFELSLKQVVGFAQSESPELRVCSRTPR